jgi:hypothetical protein
MPLRTNPFHQLYISENLSPEDYIKLFSPLVVTNADSALLFQPGNIILEGNQGSGKSMILSLFQPEIRIAYHKAGEKFPIPDEFNKFVSGGINLTLSGVIDFGQRISQKSNVNNDRLIRYFGDFINYWIILDLFSNLQTLTQYAEGALNKEIGINFNTNKFKSLVTHLCKNECWFGYLESAKSYQDILKLIEYRISRYKRFMNGHIDELEQDIIETVTEPGKPISQTVKNLYDTGILLPEVLFFARIDQCEKMVHLEVKAQQHQLHIQFRSIINKMLGSREPHVSYRLGTRKYTFRESYERQMYGTAEPIEDFRNFKVFDIDKIFQRTEHITKWIFPRFAEDVFKKRLRFAGYPINNMEEDTIAFVLGGKQLYIPEKISKYYIKNNHSKGIINLEDWWPDSIKEHLTSLVESDVLSAKLGEAWVRQQYSRDIHNIPEINNLPWESEEKRWWKKERVFLASLQIAAKRAQKLIWARESDVIDLSGGNILIFLSMMQHIWEAWLRSQSENTDWYDNTLPCIDNIYIHTEGIEEASDRWYDKIIEEPGGDSRKRFIAFLGIMFRNSLISDKNMSYPGQNGISLSFNDLESDPEIFNILRDASSYGVMVDMKHTPKTKLRGESQKWYLHPIYSPHFQIPAIHTKEPMYITTKDVRKWLVKVKILFPKDEKS